MNIYKKLVGTIATASMLAMPFGAMAVAPVDYGLHEGDVIRATGDLDIFIVNDYGFKRLFINPAIFNLYGHLGWDKVKTVSPATRDAFVTSGLFRNCETNSAQVYQLELVTPDSGNLVPVMGTVNPQAVFCINSNEQSLYGVAAAGNGGGLNGGAGSLEDYDLISSLNNEEVGEGESNVKVLGLDLDADSGSDLRFTSVKLSFELDAGGSDELEDYASEVSVWFGSKKVATVDVDDLNEDNGVYSKSLTLNGDTVVRADETGKLYVAVSAVDNMDSADLGSGWTVTVDNLRFVDAQGAISTENINSSRDFSFESFASAADLELEVADSDESPEASVVEVDDEDGKDAVLLLAGTLKASGSDMEVQEVSVAVSGSAAVDTIAKNFTLEIDGEEVQTLDSDECGASCDFDDVDFMLGEGDEVDFRVLADVYGTDDSGEGSWLSASLDSDDVVAEDQNGDELNGADLTGSVTGEAQAFYSEGVMLKLVDVSESKELVDGADDIGTFTIKFDVTAFGDDMYIGDSMFTISGGASTSALLDSVDADEQMSGNWKVEEGDTATFTLTVVTTGVPADGFYKVVLTAVEWNNDDSAVYNSYTFNLDEFETDPLFLNSI